MARFKDMRLSSSERKKIVGEMVAGIMLQALTSKIGDPRLQTVKGEPSHMRIPTPKVARNELCPCGSGKKFKRCCRR